MKVLKFLGILLLILVVAVAVIGLIQPKDYRVERSEIIDAPKEQVFKHIQYWENWAAWSPWAQRDSSMETTITGTDGEAGAVSSWVGDEKVSGSGSMTNTGVKPNEQLDFDLNFTSPYESSSKGTIKVEEVEGGKTKATWIMYGENGFMERVMSIFWDLDAMVGPDFEKGLSNIKNIAENEEVVEEKVTMEINEAIYPSTTFLVKSMKGVSMDDAKSPEFIGANFGELMQYLQSNSGEMIGGPCTLYYTWDTVSQTTDMAFAVPVSQPVATNETFSMLTINESPALVMDYWGAYDKLEEAHISLSTHMAENNITYKGPVIEQYVSGPKTEADPSKWNTKIIYLHE